MGVDNYLHTRLRIKEQFKDVEEKFKAKMIDFASGTSSNMVFTEDLKHMVHLVEPNDNDLALVYKMMLKYIF